MNIFNERIEEDSVGTPEQVIYVIFKTVTDNTDTLRYGAGENAEQFF